VSSSAALVGALNGIAVASGCDQVSYLNVHHFCARELLRNHLSLTATYQSGHVRSLANQNRESRHSIPRPEAQQLHREQHEKRRKPEKIISLMDVVTHLACTRADIFDNNKINVSRHFGKHLSGQVLMGTGAWT
jgi:hypothetical protein